MFIRLDLLQYKNRLRTQKTNGQLMVWGQIRRKWLVSAPEEIVRQLLLLYLIENRGYPRALIQVEKILSAHGVSRRFDLLCYDREAQPILLVECKAPSVELNMRAAEQISNYNYTLQSVHLLITNGPNACCWKIGPSGDISYLSMVPLFKDC